jgi:hypothetical protein
MNYKRISSFVGAALFTALPVASTADAGDLNAGASQPSQYESPQQSAAPGGASASAKEEKQETSQFEALRQVRTLMSQCGGRYS